MEFAIFTSWLPDDKPESTKAVIVVSKCGTVAKRLPYRKWNKKNNGYSDMKEHFYVFSDNRGKQRNEQESWKGKYLHFSALNTSIPVHRAVAMAWLPNPENKEQVNHKNAVRNDNRAENLEWVTNEENQIHAKKMKLRIGIKGSKNNKSKLNEAQVKEIKKELAKGYYIGQLKELGEKYGVGKSTIHWIKKGVTWTHV